MLRFWLVGRIYIIQNHLLATGGRVYWMYSAAGRVNFSDSSEHRYVKNDVRTNYPIPKSEWASPTHSEQTTTMTDDPDDDDAEHHIERNSLHHGTEATTTRRKSIYCVDSVIFQTNKIELPIMNCTHDQSFVKLVLYSSSCEV
jgi:hypothetical protein